MPGEAESTDASGGDRLLFDFSVWVYSIQSLNAFCGLTLSCYGLSEVPDALRHLAEGHSTGKVIITM